VTLKNIGEGQLSLGEGWGDQATGTFLDNHGPFIKEELQTARHFFVVESEAGRKVTFEQIKHNPEFPELNFFLRPRHFAEYIEKGNKEAVGAAEILKDWIPGTSIGGNRRRMYPRKRQK